MYAAVFARVVCCVCFFAPWWSAYTCRLKSNDPTLKSILVKDTHANYFFSWEPILRGPGRCRLEIRFARTRCRLETRFARIKIHTSCEIGDFVEIHLCKLCVILRSRVLLGCVSSLRNIGRRLPLELQCSLHQGQQGDVSQSVRGNYKTRL